MKNLDIKNEKKIFKIMKELNLTDNELYNEIFDTFDSLDKLYNVVEDLNHNVFTIINRNKEIKKLQRDIKKIVKESKIKTKVSLKRTIDEKRVNNLFFTINSIEDIIIIKDFYENEKTENVKINNIFKELDNNSYYYELKQLYFQNTLIGEIIYERLNTLRNHYDFELSNDEIIVRIPNEMLEKNGFIDSYIISNYKHTLLKKVEVGDYVFSKNGIEINGTVTNIENGVVTICFDDESVDGTETISESSFDDYDGYWNFPNWTFNFSPNEDEDYYDEDDDY